MKKERKNLNWQSGSQDIVIVPTAKEVLYYGDEEDRERIHRLFGGKNYYESHSGITGAGFAYIPVGEAILANSYIPWETLVNYERKRYLVPIYCTTDSSFYISLYYPMDQYNKIEVSSSSPAAVLIEEEKHGIPVNQLLYGIVYGDILPLVKEVISSITEYNNKYIKAARGLNDYPETFKFDYIVEAVKDYIERNDWYNEEKLYQYNIEIASEDYPFRLKDNYDRMDSLTEAIEDNKYIFYSNLGYNISRRLLNTSFLETAGGVSMGEMGEFFHICHGEDIYGKNKTYLLDSFNPNIYRRDVGEIVWGKAEKLEEEFPQVNVIYDNDVRIVVKKYGACMRLLAYSNYWKFVEDRKVLNNGYFVKFFDEVYEKSIDIGLLEYTFEKDFYIEKLKKEVKRQFRDDLHKRIIPAYKKYSKKINDPNLVLTKEDAVHSGLCQAGIQSFIEDYLDGREKIPAEELKEIMGNAGKSCYFEKIFKYKASML